MESNKVVNQENQILLYVGLSNSTSVSANKHTGLTSTSTLLQGLFLQYLHEAVISILHLHRLYKKISTVVYLLSLLQVSLRVSLREDILHHLYKGISTIVQLLLSLRVSLEWNSIIISTRVSKEWNSTIVSTHISTCMSVEYIPTMSLQRYPYSYIYTIKT